METQEKNNDKCRMMTGTITLEDTGIKFSIEQLTRDLAGQYARGEMTQDEYLSKWERLVGMEVAQR